MKADQSAAGALIVMRLKQVYVCFCVLGMVIPYCLLIKWLLTNGISPTKIGSALAANELSLFFVADVILSALIVMIFASSEHRAGRVRAAWPVYVGTLLVGVSLGLPLTLYLREVKRNGG
ncbi:DUF2834 domain-containing protein [Acetobacter indonesiensis]|uniref:DUF2834 domain-containing protein n=1 Tax=Acetobacter indonesiensis TaxID=104101 RepID=UPI000A36D22F|nr:DUF2834 domain-containing protein [Acetobacter indonesiensis]